MGDANPVCAYVAVGGNIHPEENIPEALARLALEVRLSAVSTFYRTAALDRPEQADYLNGVVALETAVSPRRLKFEVLRRIEQERGRVRSDDAYAARPVDLDIVLYGDQIVNEPGLNIPDVDIWRRPFVAVPLLEIAPDTVMPNTGEPLRAIVAAMDTRGLRAEEEFTQCLRSKLAP